MNVRTLARKAGKLILTTYDVPEPEPTPTEPPTDVRPTAPTTSPREPDPSVRHTRGR